MTMLLAMIVVAITVSLVLDLLALSKRAGFYSSIGLALMVWMFANLFYIGPTDSVVVSSTLDPSTGLYVEYYLSTTDAINLGIFLILMIALSAVISLEIYLREAEKAVGGRGNLPS